MSLKSKFLKQSIIGVIGLSIGGCQMSAFPQAVSKSTQNTVPSQNKMFVAATNDIILENKTRRKWDNAGLLPEKWSMY